MMSYLSKARFLETGEESKCCVAVKMDECSSIQLISGLEKVYSSQQVYMPFSKKVSLLKDEIKIDLASSNL